MTHELEITHTKGLQFIAKAREHSIILDISPQEGGFNEGLRPTEAFIASLGACLGIYTALECQKEKINSSGMKIKITWTRESPPTRLANITVKILLPQQIPSEKIDDFIQKIKNCPVHNTIKSQPEIKIELGELVK